MAIHQISVFVENKTGALAGITDTLAQAGVDIRAMSIADTQDFGILRMIVDDWQKADAALKKSGCIYSVTPVIAAAIKDRPGGLSYILQLLTENHISLEYLYAFIAVSGREAFVALRVDDNARTEEILAAHNVPILAENEVTEL